MSANDLHSDSAQSKCHRITIIDSVTLQSSPNQTLLESLENSNVDVQYHCREGFCGACRTTLIKGEVNYKTYPLAFMDDDECLPCCCEPVSNITIKLNR